MFNLAATPRLRERAARISIFTQSHIWWKNLPEKRQFLWFTARCASFLKDIQINNNTQSQQFLKYWKYLATVTFSFVLLDTSFYIKGLFFSWFEFMDTKIPTYVILAWAWFLSHCSYFYSFYFCGIWLGRHKDYLVWVRVSNNNNNNSGLPYNPNQQEQH